MSVFNKGEIMRTAQEIENERVEKIKELQQAKQNLYVVDQAILELQKQEAILKRTGTY